MARRANAAGVGEGVEAVDLAVTDRRRHRRRVLAKFGACCIHCGENGAQMVLTHGQRMVRLVVQNSTLAQLSIPCCLLELEIEKGDGVGRGCSHRFKRVLHLRVPLLAGGRVWLLGRLGLIY